MTLSARFAHTTAESTDVATVIEQRAMLMSKRRVCPRCKCTHVVLNGRDKNRRQRFKCRTCGRTYNVLTGTPLARARKSEKWCQVAVLMSEHVPVRRIVGSGVGVSHVTAWRWRHRVLQSAANGVRVNRHAIAEVGALLLQENRKGRPRASQRDPNFIYPGANPRPSPQTILVLTALDGTGEVIGHVLRPGYGGRAARGGGTRVYASNRGAP